MNRGVQKNRCVLWLMRGLPETQTATILDYDLIVNNIH